MNKNTFNQSTPNFKAMHLLFVRQTLAFSRSPSRNFVHLLPMRTLVIFKQHNHTSRIDIDIDEGLCTPELKVVAAA
jgi:hypothetical protein